MALARAGRFFGNDDGEDEVGDDPEFGESGGDGDEPDEGEIDAARP